jgi:hypothetical protein
MPNQERPSIFAARRVEPEPAKGSSTSPPGTEKVSIRGNSSVLRRMEPVAGIVCPLDHVADGVLGRFRVAFRQEIGAFVLVSLKPGARGVALRKSEMAENAESSVTKRSGEFVDVRPAVEGYAEAVSLEHAGKAPRIRASSI